MSYKEVDLSKEAGIRMLTGGVFLLALFSLVLYYICNRNGTIETLYRFGTSDKEFWVALALYGFFQLFIFLFCGILFYRGIQEVKIDGVWKISVQNHEITFDSPSAKLQESYVLKLSELNRIEKKIRDIGDGDEDVAWKFFTNHQQPLELKYFGLLSLDSLAEYLNSSCNIEYQIRTFDIDGREI